MARRLAGRAFLIVRQIPEVEEFGPYGDQFDYEAEFGGSPSDEDDDMEYQYPRHFRACPNPDLVDEVVAEASGQLPVCMVYGPAAAKEFRRGGYHWGASAKNLIIAHPCVGRHLDEECLQKLPEGAGATITALLLFPPDGIHRPVFF